METVETPARQSAQNQSPTRHLTIKDSGWPHFSFSMAQYKEGRPKQYLLSARNIASFPFRLCNPPPSVGKVRSLSVVPLYKVRLDDVLDRQHLPPLGLKDFEEWLLFVELSPENLYFFLWLREYRRRHRQWKSKIESKKSSHPAILSDIQYSTHLNMFYARAKQTFFTPGSEYELNLSSSLLSPFRASDAPPYPDPDFLIPVELEVRQMLEESLRRFVQGQLSNMGGTRIVCGIIVGTIISLIGTIPPLVVNFVQGNDRWERLLALPGLFLGIWLVICSIHGVCLAIYVFGDLRQLRQFELARPAISNPIPLDFNRSLHSSVSSCTMAPSIGSKNGGCKLSELTGESTPRSASIFDGNIQSYYDADEIDESTIDENDDDFVKNNRDLSRTSYWDEDLSHGAPRSLFTLEQEGATYPSEQRRNSISDYPETAKFIHPFEFNDGREDEQNALVRPEQHQRVDNFDFDLLPRLLSAAKPSQTEDSGTVVSPLSARVKLAPISVELAESDRSFGTSIASSPTLTQSTSDSPQPGLFFPPALMLRAPDPTAPQVAPQATNFIARLQENRCNIKKHKLQPGYLGSGNGYSNEDQRKSHSSSRYWMRGSKKDMSERSMSAASSVLGSGDVVAEGKNGLGQQKERKIKTMLKKIGTVPAFKSPLTKIFSPIVRRGQWEIVVRTAVIGLVLSCVIIGCLLAIPVPGRKHIHTHPSTPVNVN